MITLGKESRQKPRGGESMAANNGVVVAVRDSVVDTRFDERLPPIYTMRHAGKKDQIGKKIS